MQVLCNVARIRSSVTACFRLANRNIYKLFVESDCKARESAGANVQARDAGLMVHGLITQLPPLSCAYLLRKLIASRLGRVCVHHALLFFILQQN